MEKLVRKNLSSEVLGAPMTKHSEAVGEATHSLASFVPKTSLMIPKHPKFQYTSFLHVPYSVVVSRKSQGTMTTLRSPQPLITKRYFEL